MLEGRLERILERYLLRLSPIADSASRARPLCGVDLAAWRSLRDPARFLHRAVSSRSGPLAVARLDGARVCATLPHFAPEGTRAPGAPERYFTVTFTDGVAAGPLVAHLYNLGPSRGFQLVGNRRPEA